MFVEMRLEENWIFFNNKKVLVRKISKTWRWHAQYEAVLCKSGSQYNISMHIDSAFDASSMLSL